MPPVLVSRGIPEGGLLPMQRGGVPHRHVSAVIRKLCLKLGHFDENDPDFSYFELGSALEDAIAYQLAARWHKRDPHRFIRMPELELDGLRGNLDLFDALDLAVIEIKLTKLSARQDPEGEKFWKYWVQLKAYCKMMGVRTGRLHVAHINGNYPQRGRPKPDDEAVSYHVWEDTWSEIELDRNWRMLVTNAEAE